MSVAERWRARQGVNRLPGVMRRARGSGDDREVSLRLPSGLQLVGFAPAAVALRKGRPAVAAIDESAVAIALGA